MKQKTVGLTLRAFIVALALILVAGSPALPPFDGVAYAQDDAAPENLTITIAPGGSSLALTWDTVEDDSEYEVFRGTGRGAVEWGPAPVSPMATVSETTYTDDTIVAGTTYTYGVKVAGCSAAACWAFASVDIPGGVAAPTGRPEVTLAEAGTTAVDVSWTSVTGTGVSYQVQFWHAELDDVDNWATISGTQTSPYRHENLTPGREYYYAVRAFNDGGEVFSNFRADNSKITLQATTAVPVLRLTHPSRTVVELGWTPAPAGSTYVLQRRKVTTDSATPTAGSNPPAGDSTTGWGTLPNAGSLTTTSYTDSAANHVPDLAGGTAPFYVSYEYRVRAVDSNGLAGDWSNVESANIPPADGIVGTPTISSASAVSSSSIRVTWGAVAGAAFYEIQWKTGDGNYTNALRVDATVYEHPDLSPATTYTYKVRAQDINGPGTYSGPVSGTTLSVTAAAGQMPKVTGLTVTDETANNALAPRTAKLTWNAVSGATHYDIQRYDWSTTTDWEVLGETGDGITVVGGATRITEALAGSSPTFTDTFDTGANGGTYSYVVSAVDDRSTATTTDADAANDDMGDWSDHKTVEFLDFAPADPTGLMASKTNGNSILVRWMAPVVAGTDGTATSYTIHYRTSDTTTWRPISVPSGTSHHHTGLRTNTTYFYRVRAENSGGMSDFHPAPDETQVSVTLGNTLSAPTGLGAVDATSANTAGIKLSWNMVSGADSYELQRYNATNSMWGDLAGAADQDTDVTTGTEHTDTGVIASTTYLYRVRMVKEGVESGWSAPVSGTTRAAAPNVPMLVATGTGQSMIRLSWTAVTGATSYHLEFLEGAQAQAVFENVATTPSRITINGQFSHYVHTGRKAGTQYSYRLRAVLPSGNGAWTTVGGGTTAAHEVQPWTKPAAPDLKAASTDSTTITLTWTAVTIGAGRLGVGTDTGTYRVEQREANSGAAWADAGSATCAASNTCTLAVSGLEPSHHYQFRIRAEASDTTGGHNSYWDYTFQRTPAE